MKLEDFQKSAAGILVPTENSQMAFLPNPLPPENLHLEKLISQVSHASGKLGELNGIGFRWPNPDLLIRPFQRREAVASSSMEGTYTTLSELYLFEQNLEKPTERDVINDTIEVMNYVRAQDHSLKALGEIPICTRMILEMHKILLSGVKKQRGGETNAGQYKRAQNYIGYGMRFIPPPPLEVEGLMANLESFINTPPPEYPPLVVAALAHYQFETIHPFGDGNGRVGRMLIPLILKSRNALRLPLLHMSPAIEQNKDEYIERLYRVSSKGEWQEWIGFFLRMVEITCEDTIRIIQALIDLKKEFKEKLQNTRSSTLLLGLVDILFEEMLLTAPSAQNAQSVSFNAAKTNLEKLVEIGVLAVHPHYTHPRVYYSPKLLEILKSS